jgi:hypothetical protein
VGVAPRRLETGLRHRDGRAALSYGFDMLGLERIFAITMPGNRPSQAVLTRGSG